jgi:hypothetical protein
MHHKISLRFVHRFAWVFRVIEWLIRERFCCRLTLAVLYTCHKQLLLSIGMTFAWAAVLFRQMAQVIGERRNYW